MDREETLAGRYCEYLGLRLEVTRRPDGRISVIRCCPTGPAVNRFRSVEYSSFKGFFFGDDYSYGMCEKLSDNFYNDYSTDPWNRINDMIIPAANLDELEMQLSIRGF